MFESIYHKQLSEYYALRAETLSVSARMHELCYLRRFDRFLITSTTCDGTLNEDIIDQWMASLTGKSSSIENEVIVVRQFLAYLKLSGVQVYIPAVPKVYDDYIPYIFSDEELKIIFSAADNITQHSINADPYLVFEFPVILRLMYSCGLRIGETVQIDIENVDLANGVLKLINTKGDKHRIVPMSRGMTDILVRYINYMGIAGNRIGWLFPSGRKDGHISDKAIRLRFRMILEKSGIYPKNSKKRERGPCLHCMRHVFAFKSFAQAERAGRHLDDAVPYLSIYLGHDSLYETEKYLKFSNEMFPESIDAFGEFMEGVLPEVDYET